MTEFIKRIQCPAAEFGLPECEEQISFRYRYNPRDPDMTYQEADEFDTDCDCYERLSELTSELFAGAASRYVERVNSLLDAAPEEYFYDGD
jgi:hypothetical protein